jgi:hypothetical protein
MEGAWTPHEASVKTRLRNLYGKLGAHTMTPAGAPSPIRADRRVLAVDSLSHPPPVTWSFAWRRTAGGAFTWM